MPSFLSSIVLEHASLIMLILVHKCSSWKAYLRRDLQYTNAHNKEEGKVPVMYTELSAIFA
jgi:hypothetical protein